MPGRFEKARRLIPVLRGGACEGSAAHVERRGARPVRQRDLVEPAPWIRDARAEGVDRSRVALETVDPETWKLGEELQRVGAVVAPDLQDQRVVTVHELVDLGLGERSLVMVALGQPACPTSQARAEGWMTERAQAEAEVSPPSPGSELASAAMRPGRQLG